MKSRLLNDLEDLPIPYFRNHIFYESGDLDAPAAILDSNNDVVLTMCKVCGLAESELVNGVPCFGVNQVASSCKNDFEDFGFLDHPGD